MRRLWTWLKGRWQWLLLGATLLFGGLFVRERRILGKVRDELALARAKREVARLEGERAAVSKYADTVEAEIERIDAEIHEARLRAVRAHEGGEELRGEALLDAFKELGF